MKKFSSMLAFGLAMALVFGMTVSAAPSTSTESTDVSDKVVVEDAAVTETVKELAAPTVDLDKMTNEQVTALSQASATQAAAVETVGITSDTKVAEGVTVEVTAAPLPLATQAVTKEVAVKAVEALKLEVADGKSVAEATQVKASLDIDLNVTGATKDQVIGNGIKIAFATNITPVEGKKYLVLHEYEAGKWETVPAAITNDGTVIATFKSLSPVVIVEVDGKAGNDDEDSDDDSTEEVVVAADGTVVAPKTGEALPVAGILAVICLAGAALCAKKVRFNN